MEAEATRGEGRSLIDHQKDDDDDDDDNDDNAEDDDENDVVNDDDSDDNTARAPVTSMTTTTMTMTTDIGRWHDCFSVHGGNFDAGSRAAEGMNGTRGLKDS